MSKANSTLPSRPCKPSADYPLFPHATGRWAKKIRGKLHYFGKWDDPDGALTRYLDQKGALHAGLTPVDSREGLTVLHLCGRFLTAKKQATANGELSARTFGEYTALCKRLVKSFGKSRLVADLRQDDFAKLRARMATNWGPVRLKAEIIRAKTPFNWALKSGLLDRPIVFGEGFKTPSARTIRKHRAEQGPKLFEADEILRMLDAAGQPLKTMILLGVNAGYGNSDVATLPLDRLDVHGGWINYARPKTGIARRCLLWPETVLAIKEWLAQRPAPADSNHVSRVFVTRWGRAWDAIDDRAITKEFRKLLNKLEIKGHRNFYCLRHTLQTIGDEARDFVAVRKIMGHAGGDIADEYRERVSDDRLRAVAEHVRGWLFAPAAKSKVAGTTKSQTKVPPTNQNPNLRLFTA